MEALAAHGIETEMIKLDTDVDIYNMQTVQLYGIYPFSFEKAVAFMKEQGIKLVYDIDDASSLVEITNPFYYAVKRDGFSEHELFAAADHITVATPYLAEYARQKTHVPVTIVPNCFTPSEWMFPRPKRDGIRIGFAGSPSHIDDLVMILPAIINLQNKYNGVRFLLYGLSQGDYPSFVRNFRFLLPKEGLPMFERFMELMNQVKFEWIPWSDFDSYPSVLTNMALDIGLCPLRSTPFNDARSASKAMEYTLSGALAMASNVVSYKSDKSSVLVNDTEWEEALEYYIIHPEIQEKKHVEHLFWLEQNRNINTQVELLKSIYVV